MEPQFRLHKLAIFDLTLPHRGRGISFRKNFNPDGPLTFVGGPFCWAPAGCKLRRRHGAAIKITYGKAARPAQLETVRLKILRRESFLTIVAGICAAPVAPRIHQFARRAFSGTYRGGTDCSAGPPLFPDLRLPARPPAMTLPEPAAAVGRRIRGTSPFHARASIKLPAGRSRPVQHSFQHRRRKLFTFPREALLVNFEVRYALSDLVTL
jgi:hypothetical protein